MPQVGTIHKLAGSKYLSLYQMDAVQRDGTHFDYYMASRIGDAARLKAATKENHADGVVIFAADDQDRIVLIRQYRYPVGRFVYELPAGLVEPGEDPRQAAVRELFEETGFRTRLIPGAKAATEYRLSSAARKQVVFFLGEVHGEPRLQAKEIESCRWAAPGELEQYLLPQVASAAKALLARI